MFDVSGIFRISLALTFVVGACGGGDGNDKRDELVESMRDDIEARLPTPIENIPTSGTANMSGYMSGEHEYTGVDRYPAYADVHLQADFAAGRVNGTIDNFVLYSPDGPYSPPIIFYVNGSEFSEGIYGNEFQERMSMVPYTTENCTGGCTVTVTGGGTISGTFYGENANAVIGTFYGGRYFQGDVLFPYTREISGTIVAVE